MMSTIQNTQTAGGNDQAQAADGDAGKASGKAKKAASAFRTISEVAEDLGVQQHVLRFWETKFSQVKPLKRGGGRRYYRPEDVALLKKIHHLLYTEGYTIKGVQKLMRGQGRQQLVADDIAPAVAPAQVAAPANQSRPAARPAAEATPAVAASSVPAGLSDKQRSILQAMLGDLKELRDAIKGEGEG